MKLTKNTCVWLRTGLIVLLSLSALPTRSDPAGQWTEYQANYYGYGGDYLDMARYNFDFRQWEVYKRFPIAVPHASPYIVKSKSGIGNPVTITSADQVQEHLQYDTRMLPIVARADIDDSSALLSDGNYRSQKGWAIFMAVQVMFVCSDTSTITGPVSVTGGTSSYAANSTAGSLVESWPLCQGAPPVYISAAYAHGIGPQ